MGRDQIHITLEGGKPETQYSPRFLQGMVNRMLTSYHKYGHVEDAVNLGIDMVGNLEMRIARYKETGNTEWLMDVANYAMIEWMYPQHPNAHFEATDSKSSPGRVMRSGRKIYGQHNDDVRPE